MTTRPPRDGEVNGRDYFFVSLEDFKSKIVEEIKTRIINPGSIFQD